MRLDDSQIVLYSRGSVEFFRTYPGMYVPRALLLRCQENGAVPRVSGRRECWRCPR